MVVLTIILDFMPEKAREIEESFRKRFLPAISRQKGFRNAHLAKRLDNAGQMLILLFFDSEKERLDWVSSPEHGPAWDSISGLCDKFSAVSHELVASAVDRA